jgi:hypothetical protein
LNAMLSVLRNTQLWRTESVFYPGCFGRQPYASFVDSTCAGLLK